mgnify:CR=1 FL=1
MVIFLLFKKILKIEKMFFFLIFSGWKSPLVVMSTQLEGKIIEYHMSSDEFTDEYKEALKTSIMVENFFDSPVPQKVTKKATKRKSTTYYDSDKGSEDEDYSPTKSKYKEDREKNKNLTHYHQSGEDIIFRHFK